MKKSILMTALTALMSVFAPVAGAYEPVVPPAGLAEEQWRLFYDDYRYLGYGEPRYQYHNLIREVAMVRDGDDVYIKGVFGEYPEAWIKGTVEDGELNVDGTQMLEDSDGAPVYFLSGTAVFDSSKTDSSDFVYTRFWRKQSVRFMITEDGGTMAVLPKTEGYPSFWYSARATDMLTLRDGNVRGEREEYPDVDYMLDMCFKKAGVSGVESILGADTDDASAPMYDLQGREVNPETASPGIYIRAGKKIMVR